MIRPMTDEERQRAKERSKANSNEEKPMLIDEVKAALENATPGPWRFTPVDDYGVTYQVRNDDGAVICCDTDYYPTNVGPNDGVLIALAHDMARKLIEDEAKLIAAEELAEATEMVCDQVYNRPGGASLRAVGELRAARAAYRKAGETYAD